MGVSTLLEPGGCASLLSSAPVKWFWISVSSWSKFDTANCDFLLFWNTLHFYYHLHIWFLADPTFGKMELMSWLSSVCLSIRPSVRHGCILAKRCKIGLIRLLLITNMKSHRPTGFQMRWMTWRIITHYGIVGERYVVERRRWYHRIGRWRLPIIRCQ